MRLKSKLRSTLQLPLSQPYINSSIHSSFMVVIFSDCKAKRSPGDFTLTLLAISCAGFVSGNKNTMQPIKHNRKPCRKKRRSRLCSNKKSHTSTDLFRNRINADEAAHAPQNGKRHFAHRIH